MLYLVRKNRGVFVTPQEAMAALDNGQMIKFEDDFKMYGIDQTIHDSLRNFKVTNYQFTSNSGGVVVFPDGYQHLFNGVFTVTGSTVNAVNFLNPDELPYALTNQLRKVTTSNPVAIDNGTGFIIYPQSVQIGFYSYLKRPAVPVYGYTQIGRDVVYDPLTSVQLEWEDAYLNSVVAKSMQFLGVNMDESGIVAFSNQYNQETVS